MKYGLALLGFLSVASMFLPGQIYGESLVQIQTTMYGNYVFDINSEDKDRIVRVYSQIANFDMDEEYFTINIVQSSTGDIVKSTQQNVYSTSKGVVNFNSFLFYLVDDRDICAIDTDDLGENQACPEIMTGKYELQIQSRDGSTSSSEPFWVTDYNGIL